MLPNQYSLPLQGSYPLQIKKGKNNIVLILSHVCTNAYG